MIKVYYQDDIVARLASILTYGLNGGYSFRSIEERFVASPFVRRLESGEYDIESTLERAVEEAYSVSLKEKADISFKGLFFAQTYFRLFLCFGRSFEYLFLYWPLSSFDERYGIYHEMDFSNLREDFERAAKQTSLFRKLCLERRIKARDVSRLTGINANTLNRYSQDDRFLAGASFDTVYRLSSLFGVKPNTFATDLGVYLDPSIYIFDESNRDYRNWLGFYYANLFDHRLDEKDFEYEPGEGIFVSRKTRIRIVVPSGEGDKAAALGYGQDDYLVVFDDGLEGRIDLARVTCFEAMVVSQESALILKKGAKKEITDTIARSLAVRAREAVRREGSRKKKMPK